MTPAKYNHINELLAEYSSVSAALEGAEAQIKKIQLSAASGLLPEHAGLKVKLTDIEAKLRTLADENYGDLFPAAEEKRTHNTPFGSLKYHKSSSLDFKDVEKVLLKMRLACNAEEVRVRNTTELPRFTWDQIVRTHEEPNLAALGDFDEATLALFGITREQDDNFKIVPFDMKSDKPAKAQRVAHKEAA